MTNDRIDDRIETGLRAALLADDPGEVPSALRMRVASIPERIPGPRRPARIGWPSRRLAWIEGVAAVALIVVLTGVTLVFRGSNVGPAASSTASAPPTENPVASPTKTPIVTPTRSPNGDAWGGLSWSAPSEITDATNFSTVIAWNGGYIAAGLANPPNSPGLWRSSDGTTWTRLQLDPSVFAQSVPSGLSGDVQSGMDGLVQTPSGLLAWGRAGTPTCGNEGESQKCYIVPSMIWTSPDGTDWKQADMSAFAGAGIQGVAVGAHGLVAVGNTGSIDNTGSMPATTPVIWVSETGSTWQRLSLPADFKDSYLSTVQATAQGYVLGGEFAGGYVQIAGGGWTAVNPVAAAWWSADGLTWTKASVQPVDNRKTNIRSIWVGADGLIAVGYSWSGGPGVEVDGATAAWASTDGRSWRHVALSYPGAPTASPDPNLNLGSNLILGDGTHLITAGVADATGTMGIWVSSDGVTWQRLAFSGATGTIPDWHGPGAFNAVFPVPGGFIVTGEGPGKGVTGTDLPPLQVWRLTATP